jgi:hypothetical protein
MASSRMADSAIFVEIQRKIDDDTKFREELREITQDIEKQSEISRDFVWYLAKLLG